jgi:hypothetical protein
MEIIRRGTPPQDRTHEGTCKTCGTVVRFKEYEAVQHSDRRGGTSLTVTCPVCKGLVSVCLSPPGGYWVK